MVGPSPGHPLCVEHYAMLQDAVSKQNEGLERAINMLEGHIDVVGLPRPTPSFPERKPPVVIHQPKIDNSIHIDRSVVGSVNTGTINSLDVSMSNINVSNAPLAMSLKHFAEAVAKEGSLSAEQKQEILDQLSALTQEIEQPKERRRTGVVKTLMSGIKSSIQVAVTLDSLWSLAEHLIRACLGL